MAAQSLYPDPTPNVDAVAVPLTAEEDSASDAAIAAALHLTDPDMEASIAADAAFAAQLAAEDTSGSIPNPPATTAHDQPRLSASSSTGPVTTGNMTRAITAALQRFAQENILGTVAVQPAAPNARLHPRTRTEHTLDRTASGEWFVQVASRKSSPTVEALRLGPFSSEEEAIAEMEASVPPAWAGAAACMRCSRAFGLTLWRHHCRNCGMTVCKDCRVSWPAAALPPTFVARREKSVHVCLFCHENATALRAALLQGGADAVKAAFLNGMGNINLRRPCVQVGTHDATQLPVHCAAATNSLATLRWLAEEQRCPLIGPQSLTLGRPAKTVLRVAIERTAIDVLQWLIAADDAAPHTGVPLRMPSDSECAPAAVHRALEAALRECHRQRVLTNLALDSCTAANVPARSARPETHSSEAPAPIGSVDECVVCLAAPRECVLVACGHACVCQQCSGTLASCPICRSNIERAIRLFS
mmetsp:Transcript_70648/g.117330  ORF Transcript_70648/g.117330 Transcript_70648/m.117330 type:complete len:474 (+) Transcript_70648:94-1515(+)|eukprot:CAMPEP_0119336918 /NCGR_PEP_ID=MMETSP1333-20130426/92929_1 /TAXON_ID=418940 /ORGANISM="Scyphosphaera apsteinii, Strain RCC1455" /LENGTH=473 /DNA_ID=CAMNT_0007347853 /DNA_START=88 /DNA_END=1509 /DNA_ORIENTATION=-